MEIDPCFQQVKLHRLITNLRGAVLSAAIASCLASSCAFSEGQPWGVAELSLSAFAPSATLNGDQGYSIEVRRLAIEVDALHLEQIAGGETAAGGHEHEESDEPAEESNAFTVARPGTGAIVELESEAKTIPLGECTSACELVRGELSSAGVDLETVSFEVVVFDRRAAPRLPPEGAPFSAELLVETEVHEEVGGRIDDGEPIGVRVFATLAMPESMFDGIDWSSLSTASEALDQIRMNLVESDALQVELERYEP